MFIVNDMGNICEEVRSVKIDLRKNESTMDKVLKKKEKLEKELEYEFEIAVIYVNDKEFGSYSKKAGEAIFHEIISALNRREILFDLKLYNNTRGMK